MTPSDFKALFGLAALLIVGVLALCAVVVFVF